MVLKIIVVALILSALLLYGIIVATGRNERNRDDEEQVEYLEKYKSLPRKE